MSGVRFSVPLELDEATIEAIALRVASIVHPPAMAVTKSPYMTIPEAANYLRCARHRVDDLLSQRTLTRIKDGRRTLVSREEIDDYLHQRTRDSCVTPPLRAVASKRVAR